MKKCLMITVLLSVVTFAARDTQNQNDAIRPLPPIYNQVGTVEVDNQSSKNIILEYKEDMMKKGGRDERRPTGEECTKIHKIMIPSKTKKEGNFLCFLRKITISYALEGTIPSRIISIPEGKWRAKKHKIIVKNKGTGIAFSLNGKKYYTL